MLGGHAGFASRAAGESLARSLARSLVARFRVVPTAQRCGIIVRGMVVTLRQLCFHELLFVFVLVLF